MLIPAVLVQIIAYLTPVTVIIFITPTVVTYRLFQTTHRIPSPPGRNRKGENHINPTTIEFGSRVFKPK